LRHSSREKQQHLEGIEREEGLKIQPKNGKKEREAKRKHQTLHEGIHQGGNKKVNSKA